ncbi:MAG TPA: peptide deformylase [Acidimicrobiales bacterium]
MPAHEIRVFGDPVLKTQAAEITNIDGALVSLADEMLDIMYEAPGLGLAAPQIGVQKQLFVYDLDDDTGPHTLVNPRIIESRGEWVHDEGCLSIPGLYVEIVRPKEVLLAAHDLDGNEVEIEADELMARLFQHELDHLHGVLMFERMTPEQRKEALAEWRRMQAEPPSDGPRPRRRLRLR